MAVLTGVWLFFADTAIIRTESDLFILNGMGFFLAEGTSSTFAEPNLPMSSVLFFTVLAGIATIFLYKNRRKQITVTTLLMILSAIHLVLLFAIGKMMPSGIDADNASIEFTWKVLFAAALPVLFFLALRGIQRDDRLVRSADRLR
jgi:uncharacterized membrane protein